MMLEVFQANWLLLLLALFLGLFIAWWIWSKPSVDAQYDDSVNNDDVIDAETTSADMLSEKAMAGGDTNAATKTASVTNDAVQSSVEKTSEVANETAKATKSAAKKAVSKTASKTKKVASTAKKKAATAKDSANETAKKAAASAKQTSDKAKKNIVKSEPKPKKPTAKAAAKPDATKAAPKKATAKKAAPKKAVKTPTPKAASPTVPNDLELLKGVGPKLNKELKSMGVTSFEQVAAWKAADIAAIDEKLGKFSGRITRDNWVDQAKLLSKGDVKGFEKKYGSLGSELK